MDIYLVASMACLVLAVYLYFERRRKFERPDQWDIQVEMHTRDDCTVTVQIRGNKPFARRAWVVADKYGPERTWAWHEPISGARPRRLAEVPCEVLWVIERVRATYLRERGEST